MLLCGGCTRSSSGVHSKKIAPCIIYSRGLELSACVYTQQGEVKRGWCMSDETARVQVAISWSE
jgi:hypothetical protein